MAHEAQLLRMLEPVSRPMGSPAPASIGRASFDSIDFAATLRQVSQGQNAVQAGTGQIGGPNGTESTDGLSYLREAARALLKEELETLGVDLSEASSPRSEEANGANSFESVSLRQLGQVTSIENTSLIQTLANGANDANASGGTLNPEQVSGTLI